MTFNLTHCKKLFFDMKSLSNLVGNNNFFVFFILLMVLVLMMKFLSDEVQKVLHDG